MSPVVTVAEIDEMTRLIEAAKRDGPLTDEQRRERAAACAFAQLALTAEWRDRDAVELRGLRTYCKGMVGLL